MTLIFCSKLLLLKSENMVRKLAKIQRNLPEGIHFRVISKLDKQVFTTKGYWNIIVNIKHPAVKGKEDKVKETLKTPDYIRQSVNEKKIYLFYKKYGGKYLCVITRHLNGNGFIVTTYFTGNIKEGEQIWPKK